MINLPEGVTYLATEQYQYATTWGLNWVGVLMAILTISLIISFFYLRLNFRDIDDRIIGIFIIIGIFGGSFASIVCFHITPIYKDQYLVTIDDSVSLTEFTQQYEIIDKNENIYTIREIES